MTRHAVTLKALAGQERADRELFLDSVVGKLMYKYPARREGGPTRDKLNPKHTYSMPQGICSLAESCLMRTMVRARHSSTSQDSNKGRAKSCVGVGGGISESFPAIIVLHWSMKILHPVQACAQVCAVDNAHVVSVSSG